MTSDEWNKCQSPDAMLTWLRAAGASPSPRKLRLWAVACVRSSWPLLTDTRSQQAVVVAERSADAEVDSDEVRVACEAAAAAWGAVAYSAEAAAALADEAGIPAMLAADAMAYASESQSEEEREAEEAVQCDLLRDIFHPFRTATFDPTWRSDTVMRLASATYEERHLPSGHLDPVRLAILADSLIDVGCDDAELLGHLRGPGPHVVGCWGVDAVLSKT